MRDRWFGSTCRRVPAIVLEGTVDLDGALVLDDVSDVAAILLDAPDGFLPLEGE